MRHLIPLLSLLAACDGAPSSSSTTTAGPTAASGAASDAAITLDVHVMSQCPYGVKVENALIPVKEQLGDALALNFEYIGKEEGGSFSSLHGDNEVKGDMAQLCAAEQLGGKALDFIACQNDNPKEVAENWESCAKDVGIDVDKLTSCVEGQEGHDLLAASFARSADKKVTGSPTMFVNGERYQGGRSTSQLLRALCSELGDEGPQACKDLPEPPTVEAVFLSDARCDECDLHKVEPKLKGDLAGLHVTYMDYGTAEGKALYDELKAADPDFTNLPAILLDDSVKKDTDGYPHLKRYLTKVGDWNALKMGARFDPTAEICDNGVDDDGNGQIDCADSHCEPQLECRDEQAGKLDLYVMSHCPYGAKALMASDAVMDSFGDDIDLDVHYIGSGDADSLSSLHGQPEVDDDIREICAADIAPDRSLTFAACISRDYKSADWESCADEAGISSDEIQRCFDGRGKDLLADSFAATKAIGFSSSPTFLVNNRRKFNAIDATKLQAEICKDNSGLAGCDATVVADAAASKPVPAGECK